MRPPAAFRPRGWCCDGGPGRWGHEVCSEATGGVGQGLEGWEGVLPVGLPDKM